MPIGQIRNVYNSRPDCENRIKELEADFGLDSFCLNDFWATEAPFRFIMVAYNLIALFKFAALQSRQFATLRTVKSYCFALGAWLNTHANKTKMKISLPVKRRQWIEGIFHSIEQKSFPIKYAIA